MHGGFTITSSHTYINKNAAVASEKDNVMLPPLFDQLPNKSSYHCLRIGQKCFYDDDG